MVLMTPERIAAMNSLREHLDKLLACSQDYSNSYEARQAFKDEAQGLAPQLQAYVIMYEVDKKLQEVMPFLGLYKDLKPDAVKLLAMGADEFLDIIIEVSKNITKYDELRTLMAEANWKTYQAYITVGFNEAQAFACTLRTMEVLDESIKRSFSNFKIEKK